MLTRRSFLFGAGIVGLGMAASRPPTARAADPSRTFTFGYDQPHDTAYGYTGDVFDRKLSELTGGALRVKQFPSASLGQEPEMVQKVRAGDIDFSINSTANTATIVPQSGVLSLHYLFRDEGHLARAVNDRTVNATFKRMVVENTTGARSLGLMTLGFRNMYAKAPISAVADVVGKKVRVQATKTEDAFFSAYRAVPIHMPFGQVYTSLQTGLVQIAENGNDIYLKNKHYEAAPVLSKTEHEANCYHLWISEKTWASLTPDQRTAVQEAADYTRPLATRKALEYSTEAIKSLQRLGVRFHEQVDKQGFIALATPLQEPQARELGPFAVQLLSLIGGVK